MKIIDEDLVKKYEKEMGIIKKPNMEDFDRYAKGLSLLTTWNEIFSQESPMNEVPCKVLFHVLLGQILHQKKIKIGLVKWIDWRANLFWVQNTRSGKGEALNLFEHIATKLRRIDWDATEFKWKGKLNVVHVTKDMTVASLINDGIISPKTKDLVRDEFGDPVIRKGLLADADFEIFEEADALVAPGRYSESMHTIHLKFLEPIGNNVYEKRLKNYDVNIPTNAHFSLIAVTTSLGKSLTDLIVQRGLIQRTYFYPRYINSEMRKQMVEKLQLIKEFLANKYDREQSIDFIVNGIKDIAEFAFKNEITYHPERRLSILKYKNNKMINLYNRAEKIPGKYQEILEGFISGFDNLSNVLAHHFAVIRGSRYVEECDFDYAFNLLEHSYKQVIHWCGIELGEQWHEKLMEEEKYKFVVRVLMQNDGSMNLSDLSKLFARKFRVTKQTGIYHIEKYGRFEHSYFTIEKDRSGKKIVRLKDKRGDKNE